MQRVKLSTHVFYMHLSFGLSTADGSESDNRPYASQPFHYKAETHLVYEVLCCFGTPVVVQKPSQPARKTLQTGSFFYPYCVRSSRPLVNLLCEIQQTTRKQVNIELLHNCNWNRFKIPLKITEEYFSMEFIATQKMTSASLQGVTI